ncbi:MAG: N-acetylmuramoyl-L-alanine amidase [Lachnospiraceae bacterium]|nr:N-acetylmuramoyl-L-alanine amidase [Lachnospiraceae bacterium]
MRRRRLLRQKRRRMRRMKVYLLRASVLALGCVLLILPFRLEGCGSGYFANKHGVADETAMKRLLGMWQKKKVYEPPEYQEELLTYNEYSRVGEILPQVKNIFVHYTANPGTTAMQNRNYFENLKTSHTTSASAHFIIGIDGEIVQCIPLTEVAYAVAGRNYDSVSIECCHPGEDGKFSDATYQSLVHLTAWLISAYDLDVKDVLRHYDENGKLCPKYYVEHEDAWEQFHADVSAYIEQCGMTEAERKEIEKKDGQVDHME